MWRTKLEKQPPDRHGRVQMIGWILVNDHGEPFKHPDHDAIVTGFTSEEMQPLADALNAAERATPPRSR